ncbi:hypothetical protein HDU97_004203 [Phlyctochytrium planicorne]|nr:hypothetical protein HDU97_004203 [Phlyctochytrium planicorne]
MWNAVKFNSQVLPLCSLNLIQRRWAGHNRWSQIKRDKGANDLARAKLFAKASKQIVASYRAGNKQTTPSLNPYLAAALNFSRHIQMPKENVDIAIKKGLATIGIGSDGASQELQTVLYEGLLPFNVAVLVQALTDKRARTFQDVRHCFTKHGAHMTPVAYLFSKIAKLVVAGDDMDKLLETVLEVEAIESFEEADGESVAVYCEPSHLLHVQNLFTSRGFEIREIEPVAFIAKANNHELSEENMTAYNKFLEEMESLDDVDMRKEAKAEAKVLAMPMLIKNASLQVYKQYQRIQRRTYRNRDFAVEYRPPKPHANVTVPHTMLMTLIVVCGSTSIAFVKISQTPHEMVNNETSAGPRHQKVSPKVAVSPKLMDSSKTKDFFAAVGLSFRENFSPGRNKKPRERANLVQKFQRAWDSIILDFQTESNWAKAVSDTDIVKNLQTMVDILIKEGAVSDGGVEPGGCTELFLNDDMMAQLVKISEADVPLGFRGEVIRFLNHLISVLDSNLMVQAPIHRPTLALIRGSSEMKEGAYEDDLVELEYDIVTKIHEHKELLYIFFSRKHVPRNVSAESVNGKDEVDGGSSKEAAKPSEFQFFLFDHLLRYVHLEGHRGDFAREACLYLVELATGDVERYISQTDFAPSSLAGLGGLFSQLPPALPPGVVWGTPVRVANSGPPNRKNALDVFRTDMDALLRLLAYVQGILLRCPSIVITKKILVDLKETFLENIVQSSITNASDFDGTTVASLFYIHQMLMGIQEDELSALFATFLLSGDDEDEDSKDTHDLDSSNKRSDENELRLGLRDILISKLNSLSEEVVTATLTVFQTLLASHSHHALHLFIERLPYPKQGQHTKNMKFLWGQIPAGSSKTRLELKGSIATDIHDHLFLVSRYFALVPLEASGVPNGGDEGGFGGSAYPDEATLGAYLMEAEGFVKSHLTKHRKALASPPVIIPRGSSLPTYNDEIINNFPSQASLRSAAASDNIGGLLGLGSPIRDAMVELSRDTTLRKLLTKFSSFFGHSFEINIALTGVLSQLASAPVPLLYMYLFASDILLGPSYPSLHTIIVRLRSEAEERRSTIQNFEAAMSRTRFQLFNQTDTPGWIWRRKDNNSYTAPRSSEDLDLDAEFLKNVIVLEETIKELLAILVVHGGRDYDQIVYL